MGTPFAIASIFLTAAASVCFAADLLPLIKLPPGKVVLVMQPHHDDHTTDYGMGGLIARFVDEGYDVYYVRASNDEKDGTRLPAESRSSAGCCSGENVAGAGSPSPSSIRPSSS